MFPFLGFKNILALKKHRFLDPKKHKFSKKVLNDVWKIQKGFNWSKNKISCILRNDVFWIFRFFTNFLIRTLSVWIYLSVPFYVQASLKKLNLRGTLCQFEISQTSLNMEWPNLIPFIRTGHQLSFRILIWN
jgi:hypothetical protein